MGRLVPLRDELIRGDRRSLYLGWLAGAAEGEVRDHVEPPVPAGLSQMSAAQTALAAFLEIDADMIAAAAMGSADSSDRLTESVDAWLQSLSLDELRSMLRSIVQAHRSNQQREIASRYQAWQRRHRRKLRPTSAQCGRAAVPGRAGRRGASPPRCLGARTRGRRAACAARRPASAADVRCRDGARPSSGRARQRVGLLEGVCGAEVLSDLAEAYAIVSERGTFDRELRRFLVRHAKRGALLRRLAEAGLWQS